MKYSNTARNETVDAIILQCFRFCPFFAPYCPASVPSLWPSIPTVARLYKDRLFSRRAINALPREHRETHLAQQKRAVTIFLGPLLRRFSESKRALTNRGFVAVALTLENVAADFLAFLNNVLPQKRIRQ